MKSRYIESENGFCSGHLTENLRLRHFAQWKIKKIFVYLGPKKNSQNYDRIFALFLTFLANFCHCFLLSVVGNRHYFGLFSMLINQRW